MSPVHLNARKVSSRKPLCGLPPSLTDTFPKAVILRRGPAQAGPVLGEL